MHRRARGVLRWGFPAAACALGTWQVMRLREKRAHIASVEAALAQQPSPVTTPAAAASVLAAEPWRRLALTARVQPSDPPAILVGPRPARDVGIALAYEVFVPVCVAPAGGTDSDASRTVLVNAGRVPASAASRALAGVRECARSGKDVPLVVVREREERPTVFLSDTKRPSGLYAFRDADAMAGHLGCTPGLMLRAVAPDHAGVEQSLIAPEILVAPLRVDIPNRHLEYVITWFGIAAATAVLGRAL